MGRVPAQRTLENALRRFGFCYVAGVDEVGRGCLAGPVVAAAVVLDPVGERRRQGLVLQAVDPADPAVQRCFARRQRGEVVAAQPTPTRIQGAELGVQAPAEGGGGAVGADRERRQARDGRRDDAFGHSGS